MDLPFLSDLTHPRLQWGVVIGASLVAAATDLRARRIPNLLTGPLLLFGLLHAGLTGGLAGVASALGATLVVAAPFVFLFVFAGGGAGDAKLMGAIGAVLGLSHGLLALACTCFAGVVLAVAWEALRGGLGRLTANLSLATHSLVLPILRGRRPDLAGSLQFTEDDTRKMPYGLAILTGVSCAWAVVLL